MNMMVAIELPSCLAPRGQAARQAQGAQREENSLIIIILGVDHELQRTDPTGNLTNLIQGLIDKGPVDLIAEEAKQNDATIAHQIALDRSIRWLSIDATVEDKTRLGIYDELMNRPKHLIFEGDMCVGEKGQYLSNADAIREELWVSRTLAGEANAAMIVCGLERSGTSPGSKLHEQFMATDVVVTRIEMASGPPTYGEV
jgi:hypothetical protein